MTDYREDFTLDEMADNDREMVDVAIKGAKKYSFYDIVKAQHFIGHAVQATMIRCGVKIVPGMDERMVERLQKINNVAVESRSRHKGDDQWRDGVYIYKSGELVAFVSTVLTETKSVICTGPDKYFIITNAKV